jgi:hypothetical protein
MSIETSSSDTLPFGDQSWKGRDFIRAPVCHAVLGVETLRARRRVLGESRGRAILDPCAAACRPRFGQSRPKIEVDSHGPQSLSC